MFLKILSALCLMALCVLVHALGVTVALRRMGRLPRGAAGFGRVTWVLVMLASWMILFHLAEIAVWACYFAWKGAMPDLQTAIYFSATTYTTTGYGDLVLPPEWRLVGSVEALTGILMCGWSTGFFFAAVNRIFEAQPPVTQEHV